MSVGEVLVSVVKFFEVFVGSGRVVKGSETLELACGMV